MTLTRVRRQARLTASRLPVSLGRTTDWDAYGRGRDPRCENCMAHCGYEPTAVLETTRSLRQALRAMLQS
jgi:hypothetical protein